MLFMLTYSLAPDHRDAAQARFKETGGLPPDGSKMLGRWHDAAGLRGWVLFESSSALSIASWAQAWSDHLTLHVVPVATDEEFTKILGG